ncbi:hypothetical protein SAMN05877753_108173 [Bacillus oleivorans]|uniref:Uncharacterized protein n=1 Tax=Bacillus oleivorans TaxID=1448271 RepID=A0A285D2U1_9BACI|nr:hypothetical protein [Bacillus oleivorans]SNX74137.1 hypothetical protein SAMN05877753_108173 [Bacillus oleivorans]
MGYYLPFHDYGAAQYVNRIHKQKYPNHLVLAPVKITKNKKVKREDFINSMPAKSYLNTNKTDQSLISQTIQVNQNLLFEIEGKGKFINESI